MSIFNKLLPRGWREFDLGSNKLATGVWTMAVLAAVSVSLQFGSFTSSTAIASGGVDCTGGQTQHTCLKPTGESCLKYVNHFDPDAAYFSVTPIQPTAELCKSQETGQTKFCDDWIHNKVEGGCTGKPNPN